MAQLGQQQFQAAQGGGVNDEDATLCRDMLMTERYVSNFYDDSIFCTTNPQVRQALQHIQKEEQKHGEGILNYIQQHGMQNQPQ